MQDLSSRTRDRTCVLYLGRRILHPLYHQGNPFSLISNLFFFFDRKLAFISHQIFTYLLSARLHISSFWIFNSALWKTNLLLRVHAVLFSPWVDGQILFSEVAQLSVPWCPQRRGSLHCSTVGRLCSCLYSTLGSLRSPIPNCLLIKILFNFCNTVMILRIGTGTSLMVQEFRLHTSILGSAGSIHGEGTKIPQATQHGPKVTTAKSELHRDTQRSVTSPMPSPWSRSSHPSWPSHKQAISLVSDLSVFITVFLFARVYNF